MSNNVVKLFGPREKRVPIAARDVSGLTAVIHTIANWAESQGVDVNNDPGFLIRAADFMTYLQMLSRDGEKKTA